MEDAMRTLLCSILTIVIVFTHTSYVDAYTCLRPLATNGQGKGMDGLEEKLSSSGLPKSEWPEKGPDFVDIGPFDMKEFEKALGRGETKKRIALLKTQVKKLKRSLNIDRQPVVWHINSSEGAGGVSDILTGLTSFCRALGIDTQWFVIAGDKKKKFFATTARWHNILHGKRGKATSEEERENYDGVILYNVEQLRIRQKKHGLSNPDIIILHDQQPLGMIKELREHFPETKFVWNGHIPYRIKKGKTTVSHKVWKDLLSDINEAQQAVFHMEEYRPEGLDIQVSYILPAINPIALINRHYGETFEKATHAKYDIEADGAGLIVKDGRSFLLRHLGESLQRATRSKYGIKTDGRHLIMQNGRFDLLKDPKGVIDAYLQATLRLIEEGVSPHRIPKLLIAGPIAADNDGYISVYRGLKLRPMRKKQKPLSKRNLVSPVITMRK